MRPRTIIIIIAIVAALLLMKKFFFPSQQASSGPPPGKGAPVAVTVYVTTPVSLDETVQSTGTIKANEDVEIKAEVAGKITAIHFTEGGAVKKGQLLVKINDADLQAQLKKVNSNLKLADERVNRNRKLLSMQGISQEEFDALQNEVESQKAERDVLLAQIDKTELRAPFDGVAGLREVSEGAFVTNQQILTTVQQLNPLKLEFSIPENYLGRVTKGDSVSYSFGSQMQAYKGVVYAIEPTIDANTRSIRIRAYCNNTSGKVLPGAFAKVRLQLSSVTTLMVPSESIVPVLKGKQVFVVRSGKADTVSVVTGTRNDVFVPILSGLQAGDSVITSGLMQLRPGSAVKIKQK